MNTFIFLWDPKDWRWEPTNENPKQKTLSKAIQEVEESGITLEYWTCNYHKKIRPGDNAYIAITGKGVNGIFGSGIICDTPPFLLKDSRKSSNKAVYKVWIQFDVLLDPFKDNILTKSEIVRTIPKYKTPRSSGASIDAKIAYDLGILWGQQFGHGFDEFVEGAQKQIIQTVYERNSDARQKCLEHYGFSCFICNFNFQEFYGEIGENYIHVHHLTQFPLFGEEHKIDPVSDLRPICPNCHSMIHRNKKAFTPDEIKKIIENNKLHHCP